jgi:uncharacterized protein
MDRRLLVAAALLLGTALTAAAADGPDRSIATSGEATVYVEPDEVVVNVGVETFNASLDEAKAANDAASKKLLDALRALEVEERDIGTDVMQVHISYVDNGRPSKGIEGYFCRRGYAVTLKEIGKFERLVDTALKNGANHLMGFEFRTTDLRQHRDEARRLAIRAAKEKAADLARELDMSVGTPRHIGEGYVQYHGYRSAWWGWGGGGYGQYSQNVRYEAEGVGGAGGETMPLGRLAVRAQISVTFDMAPGGPRATATPAADGQ